MELALIAVAGLFAGYVNAIAGAGSLLTLPALVFGGLDASAANATNRIAVLAQSTASGVSYGRDGVHAPRSVGWLCVVSSVGAAAGAFIATMLDPGAIRVAIAVVMVVMLFVSFARPRRDVGGTRAIRTTPGMLIGFAVIGVYAGFIQAGAGVLILLFLSSVYGVDLMTANAVKVIVIVSLSVVAIIVFALRGETLDLVRGLLLAATTSIGAVVGARAAVRRGEGFVRFAVVVAVLASAAKLLWDVAAG